MSREAEALQKEWLDAARAVREKVQAPGVLPLSAIRTVGPISWTSYLNGDAISLHAWSVSPASGLTVVGSATGATVKLSATAEGVYYVTDHITTTSGQEDERSIQVVVKAL